MTHSDGVPADPTRAVRVGAWVVILALVAFQAYAHRYAVGPDGISYLDLSDAVVNGDWSRLVNLYWSPLYPVLIGIARSIGGSSPTSEVPILHVVNFLVFAGMFAAFEYMLRSILALAAGTRRSLLGGRWGLIGAYALFGFFVLTMLPQELSTPDLLSGTVMFVVFGALLRLRAGGDHETRDAVVLGGALGIGAFAKSFMVPWAAVCLAVLFVATRRRGLRASLVSGAVWVVIVAPWTILLTRAAGRFTFGDTGRMTYAWYVNEQNAPSYGGVPNGARTARTEAILPGVGATGPAPGTDPMWFDPARWNPELKPHWNAGQQLTTFKAFQVFYVQTLTPLLFFVLLIATAPGGTRRDVWRNGWVVHLPALAGVIAYSMVIVTARYVMPFVLAGTLTLLATVPRPRRMIPLLAVLGVVVPIGLEAVSDQTIIGLTLIAAVVAAMTIGAFVPTRSRILWIFLVVVGFIGARVLLPPSAPEIARVGAVLIVVFFWFSARSAVRAGRPIQFANRASAALVLLLTLVFALRLEIRLKQDLGALRRSIAPSGGNVPMKIAGELAAQGITPGTRIALIGPHAESYWARAGRLNIVGSVPKTRTSAFWQLPPDGRDALLREFAAAGATVAVASIGPDGTPPDGSWTPIQYHGWIRRLSPATP